MDKGHGSNSKTCEGHLQPPMGDERITQDYHLNVKSFFISKPK